MKMSPMFAALVTASLLGCASSSSSSTPPQGTADARDPNAPDATAGSLADASPGTPDAVPTSMTTAPDVVGPYTVAETEAQITDAKLKIFTPNAGRKTPLVVLKHGFQLATADYAKLARRIASHGFVVIGVDTAGGLFGGPTNIDERTATLAAIDYASSTLGSTVDASKIAVMGHSRGGKVAVMAAAQDPRVGAALLLDPVNGCGMGGFTADCPDVTTAGIGGAIGKPVGVMGETTNGSGGFMPCAPTAQNYATVYDGLAQASWKVEWTFTGADHMDFTDTGGGFAGSLCPDGPADDGTVRSSVMTVSVAFMRRHLTAETAMDAWLTGAMLPTGIVKRGP
jgi:pimeloyl-ACP methyl ester carboxylesterase